MPFALLPASHLRRHRFDIIMPKKSANVHQLRSQCRASGLNDSGNKAELLKRLQENEKNLKARGLSPESQDDSKCDAILAAQSAYGDEGRMQQDAKGVLQDALDTDELRVENIQGQFFVRNPAGLSYTNSKMDHADLRSRFDSLETSLNDRVNGLENEAASLHDRVNSLTSSLDAYKFLRNRFICTFKCDILKNATEADKRASVEGNAWAHGGDVTVDAQLYKGVGGRRDPMDYKKLYGILPREVGVISKFFTILNVCCG
jgi:hypothetical protein